MAKRVFFSFHYEDVKTFRANVVRNHDLTKENGDAGFYDASIWEDAKMHGDVSVKRLVNSGLENTSVTCVLIGTDTWKRPWVSYEILKSYDRENRLFGVHINSVTDKNEQTFPQGPNPFDFLGFVISSDGKKLIYYEYIVNDWQVYIELPDKAANYDKQYWGKGYKLSNWVPCYDWTKDNGYQNFPTCVENAK